MASTTAAPFVTNPTYSAAFNPMLWSRKMTTKFYVDNQMTEVFNSDYEGELKNQGDSVRIRTAPSLSISDYVIGNPLSYEVPTPIYQDLLVDKGKSFAFQVSDVLEAQADIDLMNMFMEDAAKQLKISIADEAYNNIFVGTSPAAATRPCAAKNQGSNAGVKSGALTLGVDATPIATSTPSNLLTLILQMGAALDEQNVPNDGRWLLLTPYDRQILMQTDLGKSYLTGDSSSIIRTGKIGMIDRFTVYVSNALPRGASGKAWVSGQTDPATGATYSGAAARRMVVAGTKHAATFANQVNKTETVRNPNDFGDLVRGLSIYGRKVVSPDALVVGVVA